MKLSENTNVAMPIKNMVGIIIAVAMGIFAYTEITARLTSLETSRELVLKIGVPSLLTSINLPLLFLKNFPFSYNSFAIR